MQKVLVLAPHTDDGELGCGATISKLIEGGKDVYYAAFSVCEESIPEGLPKDILEREVKLATHALGIPEKNLLIFRYPVRKFNEHRQAILEDMVQLSRDHAFETIFMPSVHDVHQDHTVIAQEGQRAFKKSSIFCYELSWNQFTFDTTAFFEIQERHLQVKIRALNMYSSQQGLRLYMNPDFIRGLATVRGVQIGKPFAEAFEVIRWVD